MKFKDGKFKILILADVHTSDVMPVWTRKFIKKAIENEVPDLIVLLGDNTAGNFRGATREKTHTAVQNVLDVVGDTAFAVVFGNHDHEGLQEASELQAKKELLSLYKQKKNCLAKTNEDVSGVGNYRIGIKNSEDKEVFCLWFIDSGTYDENGNGYAKVKPSQLRYIESENERTGRLPSMLFQHIIVPEIYDAADHASLPRKGFVKGHLKYKGFYKLKKENVLFGSLKEGPCPPCSSSEQFETLRKMKNFVAMFFGHDHVNDFDVLYKGIRLIATPSPSFFTYGNNRGVRTVTLYENDLLNFDTKVIYYKDIMDEYPKNIIVKKHGIQHYEDTFTAKLFAKVKKG